MKISKSEIDKMIKEEFQKMLEKKKLSTRLNQINEEIEKMDQEDASLNEVEASGMQKTQSATGLVPGEQPGVKFEKIGTHLKEDEEGNAIEDTMASEAPATETETEVAPMGEFEAKFAALGKILDAKLAGGEVADDITDDVTDMETAGEEGAEDFEEVEVQNDSNLSSGEEGADDEDTVEVDENKGAAAPVAVHQESVDEPIEGESPVQQATADTVNDNMEKDTHVKEGKEKSAEVVNEGKKKDATVITEAKTTKGNIFTEGLEAKRKSALLEELNRMKKFAGLSKDEE